MLRIAAGSTEPEQSKVSEIGPDSTPLLNFTSICCTTHAKQMGNYLVRNQQRE